MSEKGIAIAKLDVEALVGMLNEALAEEWLAYYQYWIGVKVMTGPMRSEIEPELLVHANEELGHAELVVNRIIQLGGTPILSPAEWMDKARCAYEAPTDPYIETILAQNLAGERCAIERYEEIAEFTAGKDFATHQMAVQILNDELEHEQEIADWIDDFQRLRQDFLSLKL